MTRRVFERRALRLIQDPEMPLYLFSVRASELGELADVARISRDDAGKLLGYQRPEKKKHVEQITDYLNQGNVLFPHALILALPDSVRFVSSRGPAVSDGLAHSGTIEIPMPADEKAPRPAWIVDGQQRSLALARTSNKDLVIPIAAFVAPSLSVQREQFLRINTAMPLPANLVTELLPEMTDAPSPKTAARKLPSALVDVLNTDVNSPFKNLIRRASTDGKSRTAVVTDTGLVEAIRESLESASGALFGYRNLSTGTADTAAMCHLLISYWSAVREVFPEAWGKPPQQSRLMHGAGIRSMGRLMDRVLPHVDPTRKDAVPAIAKELQQIAAICRWTEGRWPELDVMWNDIQNTPRHISALSNLLIRQYNASRGYR